MNINEIRKVSRYGHPVYIIFNYLLLFQFRKNISTMLLTGYLYVIFRLYVYTFIYITMELNMKYPTKNTCDKTGLTPYLQV